MEALIEMCDLIAQNPTEFPDKLAWICGRCPPPEALLSGSPRVSRSQLNAVLAVARFLSKCPGLDDHRPESVVLEFLRSVPASFDRSFWPQSYGGDSISSFYVDFLGYVSKATEVSQDFATEVAGFMGEVVMSAIGTNGDGMGISRVFLTALSRHFPPILPIDAENLIDCLLKQFVPVVVPSEASSSQSSPIHGNRYHGNEASSPGNEASQVSGSSSSSNSRITDDATSAVSRGAAMMNGGFSVTGNGNMESLVASFEKESVESLERQEIAFNLIAHALDKVHINPELVERVSKIALDQLSSMPTFLRVRILLLQSLIHFSLYSFGRVENCRKERNENNVQFMLSALMLSRN